MNRVFLIGNLTKDPELSETQSGIKVCRFSIAVNRSFASSDGERTADFFNITAWRGTAENVAKFCKRGNKVAVMGSVQIRNYEDSDGNKRMSVDIVASDVEFLSPRSSSDDDSSSAYADKKKPTLQAFDDDGDNPF